MKNGATTHYNWLIEVNLYKHYPHGVTKRKGIYCSQTPEGKEMDTKTLKLWKEYTLLQISIINEHPHDKHHTYNRKLLMGKDAGIHKPFANLPLEGTFNIIQALPKGVPAKREVISRN